MKQKNRLTKRADVLVKLKQYDSKAIGTVMNELENAGIKNGKIRIEINLT